MKDARDKLIVPQVGILLVLALWGCRAAFAQDAQEETPSAQPALPTEGNPLQDLFTPQPQYKTPQAIANPQPTAPPQGEINPLKGLFTPQPQYLTPQAIMNMHPEPKEGEVNHFKGLYTPQPQFLTPQAIVNPEAQPRFYVPERLPKDDSQQTAPKKNLEEGEATGAEKGEVKPEGAKAKAAEKEKGGAKTGKPPAGKPVAGKPNQSEQKTPAARSTTVDPNHPLRKAIVCMRTGNYKECLDLLNQFASSNPNDSQAHYLMAVTYVMMRRYPEAIAEYRKVIDLPGESSLKTRAEEGLKKIDGSLSSK